jgi:hypothetical protein
LSFSSAPSRSKCSSRIPALASSAILSPDLSGQTRHGGSAVVFYAHQKAINRTHVSPPERDQHLADNPEAQFSSEIIHRLGESELEPLGVEEAGAPVDVESQIAEMIRALREWTTCLLTRGK